MIDITPDAEVKLRKLRYSQASDLLRQACERQGYSSHMLFISERVTDLLSWCLRENGV